jgi:hypothetical protein
MLSNIMLSVIKLNVIIFSVTLPNVVTLSVLMLKVIILSVTMPKVSVIWLRIFHTEHHNAIQLKVIMLIDVMTMLLHYEYFCLVLLL